MLKRKKCSPNSMKKMVWLLTAVVLAMNVAAFAEIKQAHLNVDNGFLYAHLSVDRHGEDDLKVTVFIPELDVLYHKTLNDNRNPAHADFVTQVPAGDDFYLARITVRNENGHKTVYRPVFIQ